MLSREAWFSLLEQDEGNPETLLAFACWLQDEGEGTLEEAQALRWAASLEKKPHGPNVSEDGEKKEWDWLGKWSARAGRFPHAVLPDPVLLVVMAGRDLDSSPSFIAFQNQRAAWEALMQVGKDLGGVEDG